MLVQTVSTQIDTIYNTKLIDRQTKTYTLENQSITRTANLYKSQTAICFCTKFVWQVSDHVGIRWEFRETNP